MKRTIIVGFYVLLMHSLYSTCVGQSESTPADSFRGTFTQALTKVVESAENGFRDIKGSPDPASSGEAWFSTLPLPTARQCVVWIYKDRSLGRRYSCDFGRTFDLSEAQKGYDQALQVVNQSLSGWSRSENTHRSSKVVSRSDFQASSGISVTLRLVNHGVHGYLLYVDVNPRE
jgi:hypothetical protein